MIKKASKPKPLYQNERWLRKMYEQRGYSMAKIADLTRQDLKENGFKRRVDYTSVWDFLVKFNIPRRRNKSKK